MTTKTHRIEAGDIVDFFYPDITTPNTPCFDVNLMHVRASTGIRIAYDGSRDGWVIFKDMGTEDAIEAQWVEAAFIPAWPAEAK